MQEFTKTDKSVSKSIAIDAPASKVWNVLTTSEFVQRWLADDHVQVTSTWRVGEPITFTGGWSSTKFRARGTILRLEPNRILQHSHWTNISRLPDTPENYSVVGFELTEEAAQTTLTVTQTNLILEVVYQHVNFYWNMALFRIKQLAEQA